MYILGSTLIYACIISTCIKIRETSDSLKFWCKGHMFLQITMRENWGKLWLKLRMWYRRWLYSNLLMKISCRDWWQGMAICLVFFIIVNDFRQVCWNTKSQQRFVFFIPFFFHFCMESKMLGWPHSHWPSPRNKKRFAKNLLISFSLPLYIGIGHEGVTPNLTLFHEKKMWLLFPEKHRFFFQ